MFKWMRLAPAVVMSIAAAPLAAQDDEEGHAGFDREPERCITTSRISSTEIVDDQTIVFRMRGRDNYMINHLPRLCPGLERSGRFSYQTRVGRLCDSDWIYVIEHTGLGSLRVDRFGRPEGAGASCGLGDFHPATAEDVAILTSEDNPETRRAQDSIEVEPVDVPPELEAQLPIDPDEAE